MVLGGANIGERFIEWNFVSSSKERIEAGQGRLARRAHEATGPRQRRVHAASASERATDVVSASPSSLLDLAAAVDPVLEAAEVVDVIIAHVLEELPTQGSTPT